ncbi:hypothetical protein ACWEBX_15285 [Streptomyces sp. NPDC005070]
MTTIGDHRPEEAVPGEDSVGAMAMTDNAEAGRVVPTAAALAEIDRLVPAGAFAGERFPEQLLVMVQED